MSLGILESLLTGVGFAPLDGMGWLRVTGEDRVRWLNGMVTNSVQGLDVDEGCYCFVLNAQGKIQGDCTAFQVGDALLLETSNEQVATLQAYFDRFIIMDDVEVLPLDGWSGVEVMGPQAEAALAGLGIEAAGLEVLQARRMQWRRGQVMLVRAYSQAVERFELWGERATIAGLTAELAGAGVLAVSGETVEQLRVLEGTAKFGVDIREKELPQETAPAGVQSRALHFSKGCYLGQEIVERINSRGNLHRTFCGFALTGEAAVGSVLTADGKTVGELTSVSEVGRHWLALGYVRREAVERKAELTFDGGKADPVALPFRMAESFILNELDESSAHV